MSRRPHIIVHIDQVVVDESLTRDPALFARTLEHELHGALTSNGLRVPDGERRLSRVSAGAIVAPSIELPAAAAHAVHGAIRRATGGRDR